MQHHLWKLLKVSSRNEVVPEVCTRQDGVHIAKKELASLLNTFHPISLLSVEGKILFNITETHLPKFFLDDGLVDTSIQKAGLPVFPGCLEHCSMILAPNPDGQGRQ